MTDAVTVAIITSATSLLLAVVNAFIAFFKSRKDKKTGRKEQLDRMESKIDAQGKRLANVEKHSEENYMSLLRLTVMDSDMPMSERLIAGKEYIARNGNGDVKAFYQGLERSINEQQ